VALVRELHWLAPSGESVLLLSESGTGKEIAAQMVHRLSGREGPFCPVDAGAVPESLFESVLFGHRRGAFTGAAADQAGHLLRAHRGTLFLDEVANMSLSSQAKLLRVIEDGKVTPLGAAVAQQVDVRWIAATNVNIFAEATPFRKDLLRRLAGHVARLPPLRRRREDLGVLTAHFLRETGVTAASITTLAGRRLFNERFAGNVRQLRSLLRSAVLLAPEGRIDLPHLSSLYAATAPLTPPLPLPAAVPPREGKNDEPDHDPDSAEAGRRPTPEEIERSLTLCRGNVVRAAQRLGVHPRQLYRLIERYAIDLRRYRD
jgi:DNA-binding NtrC family response regulator